jgi:nucleoside-diphosphate-sugar epimerase
MSGRTLVTGATGYLGGQVAHQLLERGEAVTALVRAKDEAEARARMWRTLELHLVGPTLDPSGARSRANPAVVEQAGERLRRWLDEGRLRLVCGDIREPGLGAPRGREALAAEHDAVVHAAATLSRRSERACLDVNLRGGLEVLQLVKSMHLRGGLRRYVHVSTVAVAGVRSREVVAEDLAIDFERSDWDPYARTKKFGEHLAQELLAEAPVVVVRPSIVLGDARFPATTQFDMVLAFVRLAQCPALPFDPRVRLDIVPADLVAEGCVRLLLAARPKHRIYHLSSGDRSPSFQEVTDALARARGGRGPLYLPRLQRPVAGFVRWLSRGRSGVARLAALLDVFWPYLTWDVVFDAGRLRDETGLVGERFPRYCAPLLRFALEHGFEYPHEPAPRAIIRS